MATIIMICGSRVMKNNYCVMASAYFRKGGFQSEIWCVLNKDTISINEKPDIAHYYEMSFDDYKRCVRDTADGDTFFVLESYTYRFLHVLEKNKAKYFQFRGMLLMPEVNYKDIDPKHKRWIRNIFHRSPKANFARVVDRFNDIAIPNIKRSFDPISIMTATEYDNSRYRGKYDDAYNIVRIHSFDYDRWLLTKRKITNEEEDIVLFIDNGMMGLTYDFVKYDVDNTVYNNRKRVYDECEVLFRKIEETYGVNVVISGHPHTIYESGAFGGREVIYERTPELTVRAKAVYMGASNSINYPILNNKPLTLVYNDFYMKKYTQWTQDVGKELGVETLNISEYARNGSMDLSCHRIDPGLRDKYIKKYIIDNDKYTDITTMEYIANEVEKLVSERGNR